MNLKDAYRYQKHRAAKRGIKWEFTLDEWLAWWRTQLGPRWFQLRGKGKTKFAMCRVGDKGPYHPNNVICLTNAKNAHDRVANGTVPWGETQGSTRLTKDEVVAIYTAEGCMCELSQKYGVSYHNIADIRLRRSWRRATEGLQLGKRCPCGDKGTSCIKRFKR